MSMNTLDGIIRQTRKFANKKSLKLDKNSIIEHAIAYIRELQQTNVIYAKRLEDATRQIHSLQSIVMRYNQPKMDPMFPGQPPLVYSPAIPPPIPMGIQPPFPQMQLSPYSPTPAVVNTNPCHAWPPVQAQSSTPSSMASLIQAAQTAQAAQTTQTTQTTQAMMKT